MRTILPSAFFPTRYSFQNFPQGFFGLIFWWPREIFWIPYQHKNYNINLIPFFSHFPGWRIFLVHDKSECVLSRRYLVQVQTNHTKFVKLRANTLICEPTGYFFNRSDHGSGVNCFIPVKFSFRFYQDLGRQLHTFHRNEWDGWLIWCVQLIRKCELILHSFSIAMKGRNL